MDKIKGVDLMLKLVFKPTGKLMTIYDIKEDNRGFAKFLVYFEDKNYWKYMSAKYFKPSEMKGIMQYHD